MRTLWKYRKKIAYNEYAPKSQLHVPQTKVLCADYPVIDAHTHFGMHIPGDEGFGNRYHIQTVVEKLRETGVKKCVELTLFNRKNWDLIHEKVKGYDDFFAFCAPVDLSHFDSPGFEQRITHEMEHYVCEGAAGFKVWKDLGLGLKDKNGKLLSLTDSRFDCIWEKAACLNKAIVIHVADPPAFFEPADRYNERLEEICKYHFWHHYQKNLRFMDYMDQLDELLSKHQNTRFLAAHLCSYAGNLDYVSELLSKHENLYTDIAAVLAEIGRQPRRFARFLQEYPTRVLFGTDYFADAQPPHIPYFRFIQTTDEYFSYNETDEYANGRWRIYGCGLEDELKKNLYFRNAENFFGV